METRARADQSVLIRGDKKNFVYCGDAAPLRENLEKRNIPGVLYRADQALRSINRLRSIRRARVRMKEGDILCSVLYVEECCMKNKEGEILGRVMIQDSEIIYD